MKNILLILLLFFSTNLFSNSDETSNFKIEKSCLEDIQMHRDMLNKTYYTGLVFGKGVDLQRREAKKEILKKISSQIQANTTIFYKSEIERKDGVVTRENLQSEYKEKISQRVLEFNIDKLKAQEFYCKEQGELFFLYGVKRSDVASAAKEKLKQLSEENRERYKRIFRSKNILEKALFYEEIQINYLPYLMILESSKQDKKLSDTYLKEIQKYKVSYLKFLKNIEFYISIKYPYNRVYPIEERVNEVRQEVVKYLSKHSIYASDLKNSQNIQDIVKNSKKEVALISIVLGEIEDRHFPDPESYTGSRIKRFYRLAVNLANTDKRKNEGIKYRNSIYIDYPEDAAQWQLNMKQSILDYNNQNDLIKKLSKDTKI